MRSVFTIACSLLFCLSLSACGNKPVELELPAEPTPTTSENGQ